MKGTPRILLLSDDRNLFGVVARQILAGVTLTETTQKFLGHFVESVSQKASVASIVFLIVWDLRSLFAVCIGREKVRQRIEGLPRVTCLTFPFLEFQIVFAHHF